MKLLLENWRQYLNENNEINLGFKKITIEDIIRIATKPIPEHPDMFIIDSLLNYFIKLEKSKDPETINNLLRSIHIFSGRSEDFNFKSKEEAYRVYNAPYKYGDSKLVDYHKIIKNMVKSRIRHTKPTGWGGD